MGLYPSTCQICNKSFMWFSGITAQVCSECFNKRNTTTATAEDIEKFIKENSDMMDMLAKQEEIYKLINRLQELKSTHEIIGKLIRELEDEIQNKKV